MHLYKKHRRWGCTSDWTQERFDKDWCSQHDLFLNMTRQNMVVRRDCGQWEVQEIPQTEGLVPLC